MTGRTLTQPALPITFGDKVGVWRAGLAEATADLEALVFPVQVGGPVGTSREGAADLAGRLDLADAPSWHTQRRPVTRAGDALVAAVRSHAPVDTVSITYSANGSSKTVQVTLDTLNTGGN